MVTPYTRGKRGIFLLKNEANNRINGKRNAKNKSPMIEKMVKSEKALDYGTSKETLRKAV